LVEANNKHAIPLFSALFFQLFLVSICFADDDNYYQNIDPSLSGQQLKDALSELINSNVSVLSYEQVWGAFEIVDKDLPGATCDGIQGIYSAYCWSNTSECGNYKKEGQCFNREHFWPKSWWGGSVIVSYTDIHHLFPTDGYVNNRRGDSPLGIVYKVTYNSTNGCLVGTCDPDKNFGFTGPCFEPNDSFKGHAARVYFYMSVRYEKTFKCCSEPGVNDADLRDWLENVLRQWHAEFPPGPAELERNNRVFGVQGNRNPFVDHPEWVAKIQNF